MVKKIAICATFVTLATSLSANWGDIFRQMGEQMQKDMAMMHDKFNEMFTHNVAQQKIFIDEQENDVAIRIGLSLPESIKKGRQNFQADVHDDMIRIIIPETNETISLGTENNLLSVSATLKTKKEKKGKHTTSVQRSAQHYQQSILLHHLIDLAKAKIEYDDEGIFITIPYQKTEYPKGKSIPITQRATKPKESASATVSEK